MKFKRTTILKALLAIVPALLLALILQPSVALGENTYTLTYSADGCTFTKGTTQCTSYSEQVSSGSCPADSPTTVTTDAYHAFIGFTADVDLYVRNVGYFPAGTTIQFSMIKSVIVTQDTILTAHGSTDTSYRSQWHITYVTDANRHGSVDPSGEWVADPGSTYRSFPSGSTPTPDTGYELDYWTVATGTMDSGTVICNNVCLYNTDGTLLRTIAASDHLTSDQVKHLGFEYGKEANITLVAHFKRTASYTVTYATAGHGSVSPTSEQVQEGSSPAGATPTANTGYEFDYWTASIDVQIPSESGGDTITIAKGEKITTEQLKQVWVTDDTTFTAHFRKAVANVTYETDGNGTVDPTSDRIALDAVSCRGAVDADSITLSPNPGFRLAYWTADKPIYYKLDENTWAEIEANTPVDDLTDIYVADDTTFTANLERYAYAITYKTAGGGTVSPETELVELGDYPVGCTITPNKGYEFDYWTANVALEIDDGNNTDPQVEGATTIAAGDPITDEQLKLALLNDDVILTAHFKQTAVDPDDGDAIKPADGTNGKLTPKTGDTLPGATAAVALGAGVLAVGAALVRKRADQE